MKLFSWYRRTSLITLNLGGFILGCLFGLLLWKLGEIGVIRTANVASFIAPFGNILISMLKMIVIPIIVASLVGGAASLPLKQFGKMGLAIVIWYLATSIFAAVFGSFIALIFNPSLENATMLAGNTLAQVSQIQHTSGSGVSPFLSLFYDLFMNPFQALAEGRFLPVIVFAILLGIAARVTIDAAQDSKQVTNVQLGLDLIAGAQSVIFKIVDWVMCYFPIGVFALSANCFALYGVKLLSSYFQVALCVISGVMLMIFVCYPLMIAIFCRKNPYKVLWQMREPILTAFVTRSSAAALPVSLRTAENKLGIRPELAGFSLSLGATVNMDGVCVHLPVFAVLAANLFGFTLTPVQIFLLIISVVFASVGAGGVPGGSIFLLFLVLDCCQLTPTQSSLVVALALGINPLLDMFETACNVAGDNVGTYIVNQKIKLPGTPAEKASRQ